MSQFIQIVLPQFETFLFVVTRVGGILTAIPLLGSRAVPLQMKVALVVALGFALVPLAQGVTLPEDPLLTTGGLVAEFVIGMVLGVAIRIVFAGIELAGELMGIQMGLGMVQLFDPTAQQQIPIVSQYQTLLASMLFVALNMHFMIVEAVAASFRMIPPFGAVLSGALVDDVIRLSSGMFIMALKVAAPIMVTMLLIQLLLAVLGRAVAQINVFLLSFPITLSVGFFMLGLALPFMIEHYRSEFTRLQGSLSSLIRMMANG